MHNPRVNASCRTYNYVTPHTCECVSSHRWMSHVTLNFEYDMAHTHQTTYHTYENDIHMLTLGFSQCGEQRVKQWGVQKVMGDTAFSHVTFRSLVVRCAKSDEGYHIRKRFSHVTFGFLVLQCAKGDEGYHIVLWGGVWLTCEYVTLNTRITTWHTRISSRTTHTNEGYHIFLWGWVCLIQMRTTFARIRYVRKSNMWICGIPHHPWHTALWETYR